MRYRATISLPAKPTTAAPATAHKWVTVRGWMSRSIASHAATTDDKAIMAITNNPAKSSARP